MNLPKVIIKKIGYVDPHLPFWEWLEASGKLPAGVFDDTGKKLLFKSDSSSEAIQWAIDYVQTEKEAEKP